ncbi:hypothetical protein AB0M95_06045 [Sphaerisporangium sp. NPDC051017]|uniref:hypothetical protein n=1 Tax=Sphaerisporangium sp. NPDC051017 TaxID=3154636 RepID=UPI0034260693
MLGREGPRHAPLTAIMAREVAAMLESALLPSMIGPEHTDLEGVAWQIRHMFDSISRPAG